MFLQSKNKVIIMKRLLTLVLTLAVVISAAFTLPTAASASAEQNDIIVYGDANKDGDINLLDLLLMRKHLAKWNVDIDLTASDVNCDGDVNLLDLLLMRKHLAKWNVTLGPDYSEKTVKFSEIADKIHIVGRGGFDRQAMYIGFTASGFEIKLDCEGKVDLRLGASNGHGKVGVVIDGDYDAMTVQDIETSTNSMTLAENLSRGVHTLRFIKLTEPGTQYDGSRITLKQLIYSGNILPADDYSDKLKIEYYGDSITCGYGNLCNNGTPGAGSWKYQNGMQTYAAYAARELDAEFSVCASSGYGIYTGYGDKNTPKPNTEQTIDDIMNIGYWDRNNEAVDWDFSFDADIVIINLGTNDQSYSQNKQEAIPDEYIYEEAKELIDNIRLHNPDCYIIWLGGVMGKYQNDYYNGAKVLEQLADETENMIFYNDMPQSNAGGDGHPSAEQHKMLGEQLVQLIRDTYGEQLGLK